MFCSQTISVYVVMRQRITALGVQAVLSPEQDLEVLVLPLQHVVSLDKVAEFRPDVVITDVTTCSLHSVESMKKIKAGGVTKFLFLYTAGSNEAAEILALGADGVIAKSSSADLLAEAVRSLASGRVWIDENIWTRQLRKVTPEVPVIDTLPVSAEPVIASPRLSFREIEVLRLAAKGFNNREIAQTMNLTHDTIKCCMWLIVRKLRARGRVHAVNVAKQAGIFS